MVTEVYELTQLGVSTQVDHVTSIEAAVEYVPE